MEENKLNEELEKAEEELNEIEKNDKHKGLIIFMIVISVLILICFNIHLHRGDKKTII